MKLIKDLGMRQVGFNIYRARYGLFKCPDCQKEVERIKKHGENVKNCGCDKTHLKKSRKNSNSIFFNKTF